MYQRVGLPHPRKGEGSLRVLDQNRGTWGGHFPKNSAKAEQHFSDFPERSAAFRRDAAARWKRLQASMCTRYYLSLLLRDEQRRNDKLLPGDHVWLRLSPRSAIESSFTINLSAVVSRRADSTLKSRVDVNASEAGDGLPPSVL